MLTQSSHGAEADGPDARCQTDSWQQTLPTGEVTARERVFARDAAATSMPSPTGENNEAIETA